MRKKGLILSLTGTLLGIAIGLLIVRTQSYLEGEILEILREEVQKSTGCELKADYFKVRLLTLSARGGRPRIVCNGQNVLIFEKVSGNFSLWKIKDKVIVLDLIKLSGGYAVGVGKQSPTFRFIDSLTSPLPPELDRPGRWKAKLSRLEVEQAAFEEKISSNLLKGFGLGLVVQRNEEDNFEIYPTVEKLTFGQENPLVLGGLNAHITVLDNHFEMNNLRLRNIGSYLNAQMQVLKDKNRIADGSHKYLLDFSDSRFSDEVDGTIVGSGGISGFLGNLEATGDGSLKPGSELTLKFPFLDQRPLTSMQSTFSFREGDTDIDFRVQNYQLEGRQTLIKGLTPVRVTQDTLSGNFSVNFRDITHPDLEIQEIDSTVSLSGDILAPVLHWRGKSLGNTIYNNAIPEIEFDVLYNYEKKFADFKLTHNSQELGEVLYEGRFDLSAEEPEIKNSDIKTLGYKVGRAMGFGGNLTNLALDLNGQITGGLDAPEYNGEFQSTFRLPVKDSEVRMSGNGTLQKGQLSWSLSDQKQIAQAELKLDFTAEKPSVLEVSIPSLAASSFGSVNECLNFGASLNYQFQPSYLFGGNGQMAIKNFRLGCEPYTLTNNSPLNFSIKNGVLDIPPSLLSGNQSSIKLSGQLSAEKVELNSEGNIQIKAFLNVLPAFDDLSGLITTDLKIRGTPSEPDFSGTIGVNKGQFDIESAGISASSINGSLAVNESSIKVAEITGALNGGRFSLGGAVDLQRASDSSLLLEFENILISVFDGMNLQLSGGLNLTNFTAGIPVVVGDVVIESGEYQRNIEITNIIRSLPQFLFRSNDTTSKALNLPDIELDVNLTGARNLFVFTNWLNAELKTDLEIRGKLGDPRVIGTISTLNGWLGFKDRRFEINSGKVIFSPTTAEPAIELLSEAFLLSRSGDNLQVILEASGSISSPRITLSSDRGFSEKELIDLITAGSNLSTQTQANALGRTLDFTESDFDYRDIIFNPRAFVAYLTQLDSLSIEPSYNYLSGAIDPAVVAKKRILDNLMLEGESFIGSSQNLSRAQLIYSLTPSVNVAGLIESVSTRQETAFELNSTYTILSSLNKFVSLDIEGSSEIGEITIRNALRINENSRIPCEQTDQLNENLMKFYRSRGFFQSQISMQAECSDGQIEKLEIKIEEGISSQVAEVSFSGDALAGIVDQEEISDDVSGEPASEALLEKTRQRVINALRSEGYIASRAKLSYQNIEDSADKELEIEVFLGKPVSFTFRGNTAFTPEEFLETINLFERKLPLGNNTINLLIEGIEKKYRDAGYLYATISYSRDEDQQSGRVNYLIEINEEAKINVEKVVFEGNEKLSLVDLKARVKENYKESFRDIFRPRIAQAETIEYNMATLRKIYVKRGFPYVEISYRLLPNPKTNDVSILYIIEEGPEVTSDWLEIRGLPERVSFERPETAVYSIQVANEVLEKIMRDLNAAGYFEASFSSKYDHETKRLQVNFEPGDACRISHIEISGNDRIAEETILKQLLVKPADKWNKELILESKRRILRLGLFSRVELVPADGKLDSARETLLIKLNVRPLQTLQIGGGANSSFGAHIFAQATDKALFKDGKSFSLITDLYYDPTESDVSQGIAGLIYSHPNVFGSDFGLTEDLRYQKLDNTAQEFDLDRASLASYIYRAIGEDISFSIGHTLLNENLENVPEDVIISPYDSGNVTLGFISGFINLDKRDAPLNPRDGYVVNFDYKLASAVLGSEADYYSVGGRISGVRPLDFSDQRFSVAASSQVASAWTYADTEQVPISQRFYTGGRRSVRGFRENSLGPRSAEGNIIGGDILFVNNFELRYLVGDSISVHSFFDAGTVFLRDASPSLSDMRTSIGIGTRYLSPIGPIGLDLGHPLDEERGEPSLRLHFNIGTNF